MGINEISDINNNTDPECEIRKMIYLRNCEVECPKIEAIVRGIIPKWINGTLIRNGPGLFKIGEDEYQHVFDYPALIRKYSIHDGKIFYESKFLKRAAYWKNKEKQRIVVTEFGTRAIADPCKSLLNRFMAHFTTDHILSDNLSVNVMNVGDEIYACGDTNYLIKVDPNNLNTIERSKLVSVLKSTSHPHYDSEGNVYNIGQCITSHVIIKIEKSLNNMSIVAKIPIENKMNPSYYHSFSMTENYFIFIQQPLITSTTSLMKLFIKGGVLANTLQWKPKYKSKFYIISRKNGKVLKQKYISDAFAFFHTINAYEDQNHVVIDICCYTDGEALKALYTSSLKANELNILAARKHAAYTTSQAKRFILPLLSSNEK
ncbi:beta:beta-carotene 9':10'-oxygenase-like protein, partial [Leptotrombidium deliense]